MLIQSCQVSVGEEEKDMKVFVDGAGGEVIPFVPWK